MKIPTDPWKMAIFPLGIPYSLQKPKNRNSRDFSYEWQHCWPVTKVKLADLFQPDFFVGCEKNKIFLIQNST